jgi:hypothetical protein
MKEQLQSLLMEHLDGLDKDTADEDLLALFNNILQALSTDDGSLTLEECVRYKETIEGLLAGPSDEEVVRKRSGKSSKKSKHKRGGGGESSSNNNTRNRNEEIESGEIGDDLMYDDHQSLKQYNELLR